MDTLVSMQVFRLVVELQSFVAAARRMDISAAMVSKHVMALERRLGTRLLNRTSRQLSLTESGTLYFEQVRQMLDGLEDIEASVGKSTSAPHGTLRISAPVWFASPCFVRVLADYRAHYPEIYIDIDLSGRIVNLVEEGFDLALRAAITPSDNLIARRIAPIRFLLVAAPEYLDRVQRPATVADLEHLAILSYSLVNVSALSIEGPQGREAIKLPPPILKSNNETLLHIAVLQGMGIAYLPDWLVAPDVAAGRLEVLLPQYAPPSLTLYGVYVSRRYLSSKVRTFLDFITEDGRLN